MNKKGLILPVLALSLGLLPGCTADRLDGLDEAVSSIDGRLDALESQVSLLEQALEDLEAEMNSKIDAAKADYQAKIDAINAEIDGLKQEIKDLGDKLEADKKELKESFDEAVGDLTEYIDDKISELNGKIAEDREQIAALNKKLEDEKAAIKEEYDQKIADLAKALEDAETALASELDERISEIQEQFEGMIAGLAEDLANAEGTIRAEIEQKIGALKNECDQKIEDAKDDYNQKIADLAKANEDAMKAAKEEYDQKFSDLEEEFNAKISALNSDIAACSQSIEDFKQSYEDEKAAMEADYNAKIAALQSEYEAKVSEIERNIAKLTESIAALQQELAEEIARIEADYNSKFDDVTSRLDALETEEYHTVTFDSNGGSAVAPQIIKHGETAARPDDPTKTGYDFLGWYDNNGDKWVFNGFTIHSDLTLSARWNVHEYTVTLLAQEGFFGSEKSMTLSIKYLEQYSFVAPVDPGRRFAGYKDSLGNIVPLTGTYTWTENLTLYAAWDPLYVFNFDSDGGSMCSPISAYDKNVVDMPVPTIDGGTFIGWYLNDNLVSQHFDPSSLEPGDYTFVAKYRMAKDSFTYEKTNGEVTITSYTSDDPIVVIPDTIDGMNVISISEDTFKDKNSITHLTCGKYLSTFEDGCLLPCESLKQVTLDGPVNSFIAAFDYDEENIPDSFSDIELNYNFTSDNCGQVFGGISIKEINLVIGKDATSFSAMNCTTIKSVSFNPESKIEVVPDKAFYLCSDLKKVILPDSILTIGSYCFYNCDSLESINLSKHLKIISSYAFYDCDSLETISLPDSLTQLGDYAFYSCEKLTGAITVPGSVKYIPYMCFDNTAITCLIIEEGVQQIDSLFCRSDADVCVIMLPLTLKTIASGMTFKSNSILYYAGTKAQWLKTFNGYTPNVEIIYNDDTNQGVSTMSGEYKGFEVSNGDVYLFECLNKSRTNFDLQSEFAGKNIKYINRNFFGDLNPISIKLPDGIEEIPAYFLSYQEKLANLVIPNSVKHISDRAFMGCENLTNVTLSSSLLTIGECAFTSCYELTSIDLPDSLETIGNGAFANCHQLASIDLPDGLETIGNGAFSNCWKFESIRIPSGIKAVGEGSFEWCQLLGTIIIEEGVETLGYACFHACNEVRELTVPKSIRRIERSALNCHTMASYPHAVITYNGTISDWNAIDKENNWYDESYDMFAVNCTDGSFFINMNP